MSADEPTKWNMAIFFFFLSILNLVGEEHYLQVKNYSEYAGFIYVYSLMCSICLWERTHCECMVVLFGIKQY